MVWRVREGDGWGFHSGMIGLYLKSILAGELFIFSRN